MNATKPNTEQRQAVQDAQTRYIEVKVNHEANIAVDTLAGDQILAENVFLSVKDEIEPKKRIVRDFNSFLMSDDDFMLFCQLKHARREALGLRLAPHPTIEPWNLSADAYSWDELRKAEDVLIEAGICFLSAQFRDVFTDERMTYKNRQELINIILKWDTNR